MAHAHARLSRGPLSQVISQVPSLMPRWNMWQCAIMVISNVRSARIILIDSFPLFLGRSRWLEPLIQLLLLLNRVADQQQLVLASLMVEVISHLDNFLRFLFALLKVLYLPIASNRKLESITLLFYFNYLSMMSETSIINSASMGLYASLTSSVPISIIIL